MRMLQKACVYGSDLCIESSIIEFQRADNFVSGLFAFKVQLRKVQVEASTMQ